MANYNRAGEEGAPRDLALLLAWRATAHWLRSETDACRADAERAFEIASAAGDPQALAAAHTVLAMLAALEGDRNANDAHYLRALDYADRAGDMLQLIRVRTNRGSRHLEEGAYEEAIVELDLGLRLADLAGFAAFRALALTNRGEARARLGRLEEAVADLEDAREIYRRLGSRMVAYPLEKLGEIYRERGDWAVSRATYEEAISQAEAAADLQGLVPALCGLARVLAADEPEQAAALAERAVALGYGMSHVDALLAAGWVALAGDDRTAARARASEATAAAGVRRDRAGLAESIELRVLAAAEPGRGPRPARGGRCDLARAPKPARRSARRAARRAPRGRREVRPPGGGPAPGARCARVPHGLRTLLLRDVRQPLVVQALGRFRVFRGGEPLPASAWQSRKARDLLKILVARRGRPTPREYLMEALWPEQSPESLGNRLSVLLSTVRTVLDPDKRYDADHFVAADRSSVWLQAENLAVDVERFLTHGGGRSRRYATGARTPVRSLRQPRRRTPETSSRRTRTRSGRSRCARRHAPRTRRWRERSPRRPRCTATPTPPRATTCVCWSAIPSTSLRTSAWWRRSTRAGRHGEARRRFRAYCARMETIGVESASFPAHAVARR